MRAISSSADTVWSLYVPKTARSKSDKSPTFNLVERARFYEISDRASFAFICCVYRSKKRVNALTRSMTRHLSFICATVTLPFPGTLRKPFPGIVNHGEGAERETGRKTRVSKVDQGSFDRRSERVKLGELTHDRRTHRKSCARLQEVLSLDRLGIAGTTIIMVQRIVRQTRYRQPETREAFFLAVRVSYRSPIWKVSYCQ